MDLRSRNIIHIKIHTLVITRNKTCGEWLDYMKEMLKPKLEWECLFFRL